MKSTLIYFIAIWRIANCQSEGTDELEGMGLIGLGWEGFRPCPDRFVIMGREIGRPPAEENYWTGTFNLTKYRKVPEARIALTLDNPAVLTMDPNIARVYASGTTFRVTLFKTTDDVQFNVQGIQGRGYPNIVNVTLNDRQVCKNPVKVTPTILGAQPVALGAFNVALENFTPYCGRPQIDHTELLMNFKTTKPGDWPWHIAMYLINRNNSSVKTYRCGGSIISRKAIVTAAHCVTMSTGLSISVNE